MNKNEKLKGDTELQHENHNLRFYACCVCNSREGEIGRCDHDGDYYHHECWMKQIDEDLSDARIEEINYMNGRVA